MPPTGTSADCASSTAASVRESGGESDSGERYTKATECGAVSRNSAGDRANSLEEGFVCSATRRGRARGCQSWDRLGAGQPQPGAQRPERSAVMSARGASVRAGRCVSRVRCHRRAGSTRISRHVRTCQLGVSVGVKPCGAELLIHRYRRYGHGDPAARPQLPGTRCIAPAQPSDQRVEAVPRAVSSLLPFIPRPSRRSPPVPIAPVPPRPSRGARCYGTTLPGMPRGTAGELQRPACPATRVASTCRRPGPAVARTAARTRRAATGRRSGTGRRRGTAGNSPRAVPFRRIRRRQLGTASGVR